MYLTETCIREKLEVLTHVLQDVNNVMLICDDVLNGHCDKTNVCELKH